MILGFGHRARCGKDEACRTIMQYRHGTPIMSDDPSVIYNIKHYSFAKALKQEVTELALKSGGIHNLFSGQGSQTQATIAQMAISSGFLTGCSMMRTLPWTIQTVLSGSSGPSCNSGEYSDARKTRNIG